MAGRRHSLRFVPRGFASLLALSVALLLVPFGGGALAGQGAPAVSAAPAPPPPARLGPGDLLQVSVFQTPELATVARLDPDGGLTMPVLGRVELEGESVPAAEATIAARLRRENYLLDPQVSVLVRQYAGVPVTVLGAVRSPGVYWARQDHDLLSLLAQAGGVTADAGDEVLVTTEPTSTDAARDAAGHAGDGAVLPPTGGFAAAPTTLRLNLNHLERSGAPGDWQLRAGDIVRVPPAARIYVGGQVRQPGQFLLPRTGLTLLEAISMAGGVKSGARLSRAWIVHETPVHEMPVLEMPVHERPVHELPVQQAPAEGAGRVTRMVDLGKIRSGRAEDPELEPFDFVYVPVSNAKLGLIRGAETAVAAGAAVFTGLIIYH